MRNLKLLLICVFLVGIILLGLGFVLGLSIDTPELMDIVQVQEYLNDHGYDLVIDGKAGPKTMEAWNEFTGNRMAMDIFRKAGEYRE